MDSPWGRILPKMQRLVRPNEAINISERDASQSLICLLEVCRRRVAVKLAGLLVFLKVIDSP
jgi:hypothetical protein